MSFAGFPSPPSPGTPSPPGGHNVLSSAHADTVASSPPTAGSLMSANPSGLWSELGVGTEGQILTVLMGAPAWQAASGLAVGNVITVASGAGPTLNVLDPEQFVLALTGVTTVNMPGTPALGQQHTIKDSDGVALASPITISGNGNTIDGQASKVLTANYQSETLVFTQDEWKLK